MTEEAGTCYICGGECNPCSQVCGVCSRNGSIIRYAVGDLPTIEERMKKIIERLIGCQKYLEDEDRKITIYNECMIAISRLEQIMKELKPQIESDKK